MNGLPWDIIKEIIHYIGFVIIVIWGIRFAQFLIATVFPRFCPHCQRKV